VAALPHKVDLRSDRTNDDSLSLLGYSRGMTLISRMRKPVGQVRRLMHRGRLLATPRERLAPMQQWTRDGGGRRRLKAIDVSRDDCVLDFGGYRGDGVADLRATYDCFVHVFEPVPTFADMIAARFSGDDKVLLHRWGVGSTDGTLDFHLSGDGSGAFVPGPLIAVRVRSAESLAPELPQEIAVAEMNIEGGEYDLIPALDSSGLLARIKRLFIQFHPISETSPQDRRTCQQILSRTHMCDWDYPFVWESWSRKK
jgi:FkbM family methyltransferase